MRIKIAVSDDTRSFSEEAELLYTKREYLELEIIYAIDPWLSKIGSWNPPFASFYWLI